MSNKKSPRPFPVAAAALVAAALAFAPLLLTANQGCRPQSPPAASPSPTDDSTPLYPSPPPTQPIEASPGATRKVTVYKVVSDDSGSRLEPVEITLTAEQSKAPATAVLAAMVDSPDSPLPKGTKVRSLKIAPDGTATIDLSEEFVKNFPGGETEEALTLNALRLAVGQFSTVKQIQILVAGKKIDSLGGGQSLDEPLPVQQPGEGDPAAATQTEPGEGGQDH